GPWRSLPLAAYGTMYSPGGTPFSAWRAASSSGSLPQSPLCHCTTVQIRALAMKTATAESSIGSHNDVSGTLMTYPPLVGAPARQLLVSRHSSPIRAGPRGETGGAMPVYDAGFDLTIVERGMRA